MTKVELLTHQAKSYEKLGDNIHAEILKLQSNIDFALRCASDKLITYEQQEAIRDFYRPELQQLGELLDLAVKATARFSYEANLEPDENGNPGFLLGMSEAPALTKEEWEKLESGKIYYV